MFLVFVNFTPVTLQFVKEDGRTVEERKLRVALIDPPNSTILQPINGVVRPEPISKASKPEERADAPNGNSRLPSQVVRCPYHDRLEHT